MFSTKRLRFALMAVTVVGVMAGASSAFSKPKAMSKLAAKPTSPGRSNSTRTTAASTTATRSLPVPVAPVTKAQLATSGRVAPSSPPGAGCGLVAAAFCETFDAPAGNGGRTGDLNPVLWGVSRVGDINPADIVNNMAHTRLVGCGPTTAVAAPRDIRICNGQMFEALNDNHGVVNLDTYPKQPFDFTGRTGTVVFDVSADSDGSHGAWPEFVITDKPVPGVRSSISLDVPAGAANSIGIALDGCTSGPGGTTGVGLVFMTKDHLYSEPTFTHKGCVTKSVPGGPLNHFEVRVSKTHLEVWGTDPGSGSLKQLAVADDLDLGLSKGLVWLNDVHYNARKAIEPCECGKQFEHTFVWDNLGFDGPKTYRDLGFDVADANIAKGGGTSQLGYVVGTGPVTLDIHGVRTDQAPTAAQVVLNTYSFERFVPSISINGGPWINTPWPYDEQTYSWRSISIPVPVEQVRNGPNTISFKSGHESTTIANVSLILVAAAPVP